VAAARDPNPYQCTIAGAAVTDLPAIRAQLYVGGSSSPLKRYRNTVEGINPLDTVDSTDVPVLIIHGTEDERVPISHADKYYNALKRNGTPVEYLKLEGANHFFGTIFYHHYMEMFPTMVRFLDEDCGLKN
jgi:dipeptidyl aminopeptidase/acylaminoacyl peptidase